MNRVLAAIVLIFIVACAPTTVRDVRETDPEIEILWPDPPEAARIRYLYAIDDPGDLGIRPGLMKRFVQFFAGRESQSMIRPFAVAADDDLIAVADPGLGLVHLFLIGESKYDVIREAGGEGFQSPVSISLGGDAIYLADSAAGKVHIFDRQGTHRKTITGLARPTGTAFHAASGRLFVTDTLENEIAVFDEAGKRVGEFGRRGQAPGEFNFPTSLALYGDTIYVNDTLNYRVQAFALDGTPVHTFGEIGDGSGQFALSKGMGVDPQGRVYVADALSNYVQIFDREGRFLLSFGGMGGNAGEFRLPSGVFVFNSTIYIADSQNGRVQVFEYLGVEG